MAAASLAEVLVGVVLVGVVVAQLRTIGRADELERRRVWRLDVGEAGLLAEGAVATGGWKPAVFWDVQLDGVLDVTEWERELSASTLG